MKQQFKEFNFRKSSLARIALCNDIVADYARQRLRLTLRQLYYQLVSRDLIPNSEKSYKALGNLISEARLAGLMDWDAIEDRVRRPQAASEFDGLEELAEAALASYRLPRWEGQRNYVELWVEKDALAGVLWPIAREYHITLMVNRGYSSTSAMYESAKRFLAAQDIGKEMHLLYLGDHDPSGEDMVRDVRERMIMFGIDDDRFTVKKVALTIAQVRKHDPPPNPAKMSDSRAAGYVEKFGNSSWEVDALPPQTLAQLIRTDLESLVDRRLMDSVIEKEDEDKERLREAVQDLT